MKQEDYKSEVDTWLQSISEEAIQKIWHVVRVLDLEWQLRDHNIFAIPLHKLLKDERVSKEDLVGILTNLQNKKILLVTRYLGEYPESNDEAEPSGARITTIEHTPDIINSADTDIQLIPPERFAYLEKQLKLILQKGKTGKQVFKKLEWKKEYQWVTETEFAFGDEKVKFGSTSSTRIEIFRMLVDAQGQYVTVKAMVAKTGKSGQKVRDAIGDMNNENLKGKKFKIAPSEKGAYRLQHQSLQ